jgi:hypothetical protein
MQETIDRRRLLQPIGLGAGVVFTSRLAGAVSTPARLLDGAAKRIVELEVGR